MTNNGEPGLVSLVMNCTSCWYWATGSSDSGMFDWPLTYSWPLTLTASVPLASSEAFEWLVSSAIDTAPPIAIFDSCRPAAIAAARIGSSASEVTARLPATVIVALGPTCASASLTLSTYVIAAEMPSCPGFCLTLLRLPRFPPDAFWTARLWRMVEAEIVLF